MLNVKEVTEQLRAEGITDSEQAVIRWILDGKLKARRTKHLNLEYSVTPVDLASFILEKKIENKTKQFGVDYHQWEKTFRDNQKLKQEIEQLRTTIRIEQAKNRSLKRMLHAEYAMSDTAPLTLTSLLGLDPRADSDTIKKEYKKLLKALHPDRGGDERLFKVFYDHYDKVRDSAKS
ncbi:DnaJ domain-containing protein [Neobacillus niacini]|uniref:DnaJ domain-containing protein n=1 Tax=Neobacillus niacini TaxID=86668 RepID=UPI0007AC0148|nr:DnaJ domain-containing protein [Neobacillus niacini]MEC1521080.1 DnaJ domain-containing protein [Neobacillus niacini]